MCRPMTVRDARLRVSRLRSASDPSLTIPRCSTHWIYRFMTAPKHTVRAVDHGKISVPEIMAIEGEPEEQVASRGGHGDQRHRPVPGPEQGDREEVRESEEDEGHQAKRQSNGFVPDPAGGLHRNPPVLGRLGDIRRASGRCLWSIRPIHRLPRNDPRETSKVSQRTRVAPCRQHLAATFPYLP